MAKDNLLRESIADAKTLKAVTMANTMLALEEEFRPKLSSMISKKLLNEQNALDSSDIGAGGVAVDDPAPKNPSKNANDSSDIENKGLETGVKMEGMMDTPTDNAGTDDNFGAQGGDGMDDGGLDLEAIIRELEADLMGHDDMQNNAPQVNANPNAPSAPAVEGFTKVTAGTDIDAGIKTETLEDKSGSGIFQDGTDRTSVDGLPDGKEVKDGESVTEDSEVDLEEILRELDTEGAPVLAASEEIASENVELKRSLREHREVIKLLRTRINEVLLLNGKLTYTTKLFREFSLTEGQKKAIVSQFDRATNKRETQLVYSTLAESLSGKTGTATTRRQIALTESASMPMGSTKPNSTTPVAINEQANASGTPTSADRMRKLAGILRADSTNS